MIEYFKELFNKPKYAWTTWNELSVFCLVLFVLIVGFAIWFLVWFILEKIKERRYSRCQRYINGKYCLSHVDCLHCKHFKKTETKRKKRPKRRKNERIS